MPILLSSDTETYSPYDVTIVGSSRYARHLKTELLMASFRINEGDGWKKLPQWIPAEGQKAPKDIIDLLRDPEVIKTGWNIGGFEYYIYLHLLGIDIPPEQMRDTMALAYSLSLPGNLGKCGEVLKLDSDKKKDARGKKLIGIFCEPHMPTKKISATRYDWRTHPNEWEEFKQYNEQDTLTETTIYDKLIKWDMPAHEWRNWEIDQYINRKGVPINLKKVNAAITLARETIKMGLQEAKDLTGLANPNSPKQLLSWLQEHGYKYEDLKKGHVSKALDEVKKGTRLHRVLSIRQEISKSSVKKYLALKNCTDDDGYLRGMFQFSGAGRTWRWAGRKAQLQNWAKAQGFLEKMQIEADSHVEMMSVSEIALFYPKPMTLLASTLRPTIKAPEGLTLADADLNAIENRVLGWVAGEKKILQVFAENRCPYIDFATLMYNQSYDALWSEYKAGNKTKRTMAKPAVLGCFGPDTLVLTEKGYLPIIEITNKLRIHDGVEFVSHDGLVDQGVKGVIDLHGVTVTPDHKVLTGSEWESAQCLATEEKLFQSALSTASGLLSASQYLRAMAGTSYADAHADESLKSMDAACERAGPRNAIGAQASKIGANSGYELVAPSMTPLQIGSMQSDLAAQTNAIRNGKITAVEEYAANSRQRIVSFNTASMSSNPMERLRSTGSIMTGTMSRATFVSSIDVGSVGIPALTRPSNIKGKHIALVSSTKDLRPSTATHLPSAAKSMQATRQNRLSRTRATAEALTTSRVYDILNCGPRNRFVVLTNAGPVIVHNCGFRLSAGDIKENKKTAELEATGLIGYAWNMGVRSFTKAEAEIAVEIFRGKYKRVVSLWYDIEDAAKDCISTGKPTKCRVVEFERDGPLLRMWLPSGHALSYVRPKIEIQPTPWGKPRPTITYEGLNDKNQWARLKTHGGKLTENCLAANTMVLTSNGIKYITSVTKDDLLWDGVEWVKHEGLVDKGVRETLDFGGIRATGDHLVFADSWRPVSEVAYEEAASSFKRHHRAPDKLPDGTPIRRLGWSQVDLEDSVRLREDNHHASGRVYEGPSEVLRVYAREVDFKPAQNARDVEASSLRSVAFYAGTVPEPEPQIMGELRRAWDHSLSSLALVRELLVRHGENLPERSGYRPGEQQSRLQQVELSVGDSKGKLAQQAYQSTYRDPCRAVAASRSGGSLWDRHNDAGVSVEERSSCVKDVRSTGSRESVFDIVNAGPRHCFTVVGEDGSLILVHNCVQAIARDLLAHAMVLAYQRGLDIRIHVHDQLIALVLANRAEEALKLLMACMSDQPEWAKASANWSYDLPLGSAGFITPNFIKD